MNISSETKLAVATAEVLSAIDSREHARIISVKATYKSLMMNGEYLAVPDIEIKMAEAKDGN